MRAYTVSFFGHRIIENSLDIERQLEAFVRSLLFEKEYVEFLVGRDGDFDQLVSSTVRRCKRIVRDDNSSLVLVLPYATAEFRENTMMKSRYASRLLMGISKRLIRQETAP